MKGNYRVFVFCFAFTMAIFFSGCAMKPSSVEEAYNKTKYTVDEYSKRESIDGPSVSINIGIDGGGTMHLTKIDKYYYLYVYTFSQFGWCFFESAYDKNAGKLPLKVFNEKVGSGVTRENFFLLINDDQIKTMSIYGLDVRVYGKNRTINIDLPDVYVQGFLKKANEYKITKDTHEPEETNTIKTDINQNDQQPTFKPLSIKVLQ